VQPCRRLLVVELRRRRQLAVLVARSFLVDVVDELRIGRFAK
jgi:hypothetical protein